MKNEKREVKIRANTKNVTVEDFEALVKQYGYIKQGTKHPMACIDNMTLPYKRENPVKRIYVVKLLNIIDIYIRKR